MKTIHPEDIQRLDTLLRKGQPLSLREIARKLRVTYPTAKRWFETWAKDNDYLEGYSRQGARGPKSRVVQAS